MWAMQAVEDIREPMEGWREATSERGGIVNKDHSQAQKRWIRGCQKFEGRERENFKIAWEVDPRQKETERIADETKIREISFLCNHHEI